MSNRISVLPVIALLIASLFLLTSCSGSDPISPSNNEGVIDQLSHEDSQSGGLELTQSDQAFTPSSQTDDSLPYAPNQVLITLNAEYIQENYISQQPDTNEDGTSILDQYGVSLREGIDAGWSMVYVLEIIDGASVPDKVAELESLPEVGIAEPNYRYDFCDVPYTPNDPLWENPNDSDEDPRTSVFEQFGPSKIGANVVWNDTFGNPSVVVCVIDSGIAYDHEDLENVMWINADEIPDNEIDDDFNGFIDDIYGWDFYEDDNDIKEYDNSEYYHGTSCAGVIATEHDNELGCAGIAPGSRLMGVRIGFGYSYLSVLLGGVKYARDNGADILSMSFSGTEYSSILNNSMKYAWNDGLVLVAAASNDDNQELHYPAAYDSVVCVGGTSPFGKRWSYQPIDEIRITKSAGFYWGSNYGPQLEVMGFGEFYITTRGNNVTSYYTGNNDSFFRGTSNATPMVAGGFALLKSMHPDQNNQWLRDRMRDTSDDLDIAGFDIETGYGRLNLIRACYGSDRYADNEDENGFVDVTVDDFQMIDSIHAVSGDYADTEDLYKITATEDGSLNFFLDIWTWGETLNLFLYSDPSLAPEYQIDQSAGDNHATNSFEVVGCACEAGETYYIKIAPADFGDSTTYTLSVEYVQPYLELEIETYDIGFVHLGGTNKVMGHLDFSSSLVTRISEIIFNLKGTMPGQKLTKLSLYKDTYVNGIYNSLDEHIADAQLFGTNRAIFSNLYEQISHPTSPTRYFLLANFSGITEDAGFELVMSNYKHVETIEGIEIAYDSFPYSFGPYEVGVDIEPPVWDDTVGVQATRPRYEGAGIFWNSASDVRTPPVEYNIYWTTELPFEFSTAQVEEDVSFWDAGEDYDHGCVIHGLENYQEHFVMVKAIDQAGNEDENAIYLSVIPDDITDPTWPQLVGSFDTEGNAREVKADPVNQRVFVADSNGGLLIIDISDPIEPVLVDTVEGTDVFGVDYDGVYVYAAYAPGLMIIDPDAVEGAEIVATVDFPDALDLCVAGNWVYITNEGTSLLPVDITDPLNPVAYGPVVSGNYGYALQVHNGFLYIATWSQTRIFDLTDPAVPVEIANIGASQGHDVLAIDDRLYCTIWNNRKVSIFDINDPLTEVPFLGERVSNSGYRGAGSVMFNGYLYFGTESWGIEVLDVTDPENIFEVGQIHTNGPDGMDTDGIFIYTAERGHGLKIFL